MYKKGTFALKKGEKGNTYGNKKYLIKWKAFSFVQFPEQKDKNFILPFPRGRWRMA